MFSSVLSLLLRCCGLAFEHGDGDDVALAGIVDVIVASGYYHVDAMLGHEFLSYLKAESGLHGVV